METSTTPQAPPWHAAYPSPKTTSPLSLSRDDVLSLIKDPLTLSGKEYVLIDLRRADHTGGTIRTSINLPAQSLYPSMPTLYTMLSTAGVKKAIFYCGSSRGRGTRAAGWLADYISERQDEEMQSFILEGGIKGWVKGGEVFVEEMEEYDATAWGKGDE